MPWQWWLGYVLYNLGDWMTLFFYGLGIGIVIGAVVMWRRQSKWEKMYKSVRQYANPNGDRQYSPNEISPAMLQLVEMMVEKKLQVNQQSNHAPMLSRPAQTRPTMVHSENNMEFYDDGTWKYIN